MLEQIAIRYQAFNKHFNVEEKTNEMDGVDMRHKAYETKNHQLAPTGDGEDQETKHTQVSMPNCLDETYRMTLFVEKNHF